MRFELAQQLPGSPSEVLAVLTDPRYVDQLGSLPGIHRPEILEHRVAGDRLLQRLRYRFAGDLPAAVTAVLDPERLVWVEETTYVLSEARATFRILPEHYAQRLRCSGSHALDARGPSASTRRVHGELTVRYPLVRRAVERAIVSGIGEHLDAEADLIARVLGSPGRP